jgi:hypothetical protein
MSITVKGEVQEFSAVPGRPEVFYLLVSGVRYVCQGMDDNGVWSEIWTIPGYGQRVSTMSLVMWLLCAPGQVEATLEVDEGNYTVGGGSFALSTNERTP